MEQENPYKKEENISRGIVEAEIIFSKPGISFSDVLLSSGTVLCVGVGRGLLPFEIALNSTNLQWISSINAEDDLLGNQSWFQEHTRCQPTARSFEEASRMVSDGFASMNIANGLEFSDNIFDAVVLGPSCIDYVHNKLLIVNEVIRVLKNNGIAFIDMFGLEFVQRGERTTRRFYRQYTPNIQYYKNDQFGSSTLIIHKSKELGFLQARLVDEERIETGYASIPAIREIYTY